MTSSIRFLVWLGLFFLTLQPAQAQLPVQLPLEQRVAQMFMVTVHGAQLPEVGRQFLQRWQPGAIVLLTSNAGTPPEVTRLINSYQQAMRDVDAIPLLVATDQEGGVVQRMTDGFTTWPVAALVTATNDGALAQAFGHAVAEELRAVGINMNLGPVADLETNPANPIIRRRSFGSDPQIVGMTIHQVVEGMQQTGVLATLKHFPGHGETDRDSHVDLPVIDLSHERLLSTEVAAFQLALNADAIMVAHIWYPALEPQEYLPASLSPNIITGLLREQLGYDGLIMTDAMDMDAIDRRFSYPRAAVMAIQAGADIVTIGPGIGLETQAQMIQTVIDAVRNGDIAEQRIDESVNRILTAKARYGVLDWQPLDLATAPERVKTEAHATLVDDLFAAGTAVVYDNNHLLPLSPDKTVAIVYLATRNYTVPECDSYRPDILWASAALYPSDEDIRRAQDVADRADTVVVFTENAVQKPQQQALVQALPPEKTVVVALATPYDWQTFPEVAAYITTHSPLPPALPAACAVLFGAQPATGILPVTLSPELPAGTHAD